MPHGVAEPFLRLLDDDALAARRRIIVVSVVTLVALTAVVLLLPLAAAVFAAALVLALIPTIFYARRRHRGFEEGLRDHWQQWMDDAFSAPSLEHLRAATGGLLPRPTRLDWWIAAILVWLALAATLVLASSDEPGLADVAPFAAVTGALMGVGIGHQSVRRTWLVRLRRDLDEMVADGEIGVWGAK